MTDFYESLVKEYLELKGYLVRTRTRFKKNRRWSDIDVIGVEAKYGKVVHLIVGEVKGESLNSKRVEELNKWMESQELKSKISELFGSTEFEKWIYCWSMEKETKEYARTLDINICEFVDIIKYLRDRIKEKKGYFYEEEHPNLMLLQFILKKKEGLKQIFGENV
jgi:hypothetical protein